MRPAILRWLDRVEGKLDAPLPEDVPPLTFPEYVPGLSAWVDSLAVVETEEQREERRRRMFERFPAPKAGSGVVVIEADVPTPASPHVEDVPESERWVVGEEENE